MPVIPVGGNYTGFANVAHQLESEKQGAIALDLQQTQLHNRTHLGLLELDFKKDQANVDNYLRSRGLALSERKQDLSEQQAAAKMFQDMVEQTFKEKQAEMKRMQFESEFGLDQAVKESLYGVKYDPIKNQYKNLKPGEGLFNPFDRTSPWKPVDYLQDEWQRVNRAMWDRQREIDKITNQLSDIFMDKNSPEYKRLQVERERLSSEQAKLASQAELLKSRFDRYLPGETLKPITEESTPVRQFMPSPVEHTVLPNGGRGMASPPPAMDTTPAPADPIAKSVVSALKKATEVYNKEQLLRGSINDYDEDQLKTALKALNSSEVKKRLEDAGLKPAQWKELIRLELKRRRK